MDNEKMPKNAEKFYCEHCDFKCSKLSNYNIHCLTPKHKNNENDNKNDKNDNEKMPKNALHKYICDCGRSYKYSSGLCRHKNANNCSISKEECTSNNTNNDNKLVDYLMKENTELKHMIIDVCKNINSTQNNNSFNNTNSHNKTFNLQFFLNETCKDAMNIMDFVESVKLKLTDLEKLGEIGYVDGISNIIVENLNALDETKRPVHCTDTKREVLYIKDDNKWEKEDEDNNKMRKVIKKIAYKNQRLLPEFKKEHPDYNKYHSKYSDQYNKLVVESMGGSGNNDLEKEDKIIRKISKEVTINKSNF